MGEPKNIFPFSQSNSDSTYFLSQIYAPLLRYSDGGRVQPGLAKNCEYVNPKKLVCTLKKNLKFSNGAPIEGRHFIDTFREYLNPDRKSPRAHFLFTIQNAEAIFNGQKSPETLGLTYEKEKLIFQLNEPNADFIFTLTQPLFTALENSKNIPRYGPEAKDFATSGPYHIEEIQPGKKLKLAPNTYALDADPKRPEIEILFLRDDLVALQLYESGGLDFLRRVPFQLIPQMHDKEGYFEVDQLRFDYLGFSPDIKDEKFRKNFAESIPYGEFQKYLFAKKPPGCFAVPDHWIFKPVCFSHHATSSAPTKGASEPRLVRVGYSKLGGDSTKTALEWLQKQLEPRLQIKMDVRGEETSFFIGHLEMDQFDVFRKGLVPSEPTCRSLLNTFKEDAPENYIKLNRRSHPEWFALLDEMNRAKREKEKKKICRKGLQYLKDHALLIPLGPIYFSMMMQPRWIGWNLNELNQLDLSGLHLR